MKALDPHALTDDEVIIVATLLEYARIHRDQCADDCGAPDVRGLEICELRVYEGFMREAERLEAVKKSGAV